jgi:hypothetical protein
MTYPRVHGEFETVKKILKGFSIARYGDGEIKVMERHVYTRELEPVPKLANELKRIAAHPHPKCLIGIWTMDPAGTKYENLKRHEARMLKYFNTSTGVTYYSSLITRPDTGAWLETREYYEHVIQIWQDKRRIAVVSEDDSKLLAYICLTHPTGVWHVACPMYGAYSEIERLEREVLEGAPDIALLSCGPTATALAHRLTKHGVQAIDLGSIGGFLLRWYYGGPKPVEADDYAAERTN